MPTGIYLRTFEYKKKMSEVGKGRFVSEETRLKISAANKGKKRSPEFCLMIGKIQKGRTVSEETRKKLSEAKKGHIVLVETREKISETNKGKKRSEDFCKRLREVNIGRPCSEETRKKMSKANKGKPQLWHKDIPLSEETRRKISESHQGEKSYLWKGGHSFDPYCYKFNARRKKTVRDFFGNLCICTGEPQYNRKLNVHHIDHDKEQGCNGKPFNLVPMSDTHHAKEQFNEKDYQDYINKTLREGFKWGIWNEKEYMEKVMYD